LQDWRVACRVEVAASREDNALVAQRMYVFRSQIERLG
jgi:hypothetical protein